jgi:hypothetical protein
MHLFGIYRADGGMFGELRYLAGHLFRGEHCTLCDITHAGVSRKRSWDEVVAQLGIPFTLLHRNEMDPDLADFVANREACVVLEANGNRVLLLGNDELAACQGDVNAFFGRLTEALQQYSA